MSDVVRRRVAHRPSGPSRTRQSDAARSDVNSIMSKYVRDGVLPVSGVRPTYGDFSSGVDFHAAMNRVVEVQTTFMRLPMPVRRHCGNDPGEFLDMVFDPERRGELEKLGLVEAAAPEAAPPAVESATVDAAEPPVE